MSLPTPPPPPYAPFGQPEFMRPVQPVGSLAKILGWMLLILLPLQALAVPVALWESEILPRRVPDYRPEHLDALCASGEVVWVGAGLDRVALYFREDAGVLGKVPGLAAPESELHDKLRAALDRSALFFHDLLEETGLADEEVLPALWDLVWAGEVTNDAWTPLRAGRRNGVPRAERRPRRFSRRRASTITATQGRWSRVEKLFSTQPDRRALAESESIAARIERPAGGG